VTIRPATQADYDRLAPVASLTEVSEVTPADLRQRDIRDAAYPSLRLIAEVKDEIVGYARTIHLPYQPEGEFWITLTVVPPQRGQGIGGALYEAAEAFALGKGAKSFEAHVRDNEPSSLEFSKKFGYRTARHELEFNLDPREFDDSPFAGVVEKLESEGIQFLSFDQTDGSDAAKRALHAINVTVHADVPGVSEDFDWPYEHFCLSTFDATWFRPEGQIMAMVDGEPIGLGAVGEVSPGKFYNMITGVRREYRGRGIATALKVLTTRVARKLGARLVFTNNDSTNLPMIEVNRKFGYVQTPGLLKLHKVAE